MNFSSIQAAAQAAAPPVAPEPAATKSSTALKPNEYTKAVQPMEPALPSTTVSHHSQEYCIAKDWGRVGSVFDALTRRAKGERTLSYREADIVARNKLLENKMVVDQLMSDAEFMMTEDIAGIAHSVYELRRRYNHLLKSRPVVEQTWERGLAYKRDLYDKQPQPQKDKCDAFMAKTRKELNALIDEMHDIEFYLEKRGLKLWPEEFKYGFHISLCRPEYMTEDQYQAKVKNFEVVLADA